MSNVELQETRVWIKDMLEKGWIRPSLAPHAARFFFVPRPNGKGIRAVCDFRAINAVTKKILPSLPLFENVVTQVEGAKYFSVVDLTNQFYQIRVEEKDVENTAFRTPFGTFDYNVCPMGTTPSDAGTSTLASPHQFERAQILFGFTGFLSPIHSRFSTAGRSVAPSRQERGRMALDRGTSKGLRTTTSQMYRTTSVSHSSYRR